LTAPLGCLVDSFSKKSYAKEVVALVFGIRLPRRVESCERPFVSSLSFFPGTFNSLSSPLLALVLFDRPLPLSYFPSGRFLFLFGVFLNKPHERSYWRQSSPVGKGQPWPVRFVLMGLMVRILSPFSLFDKDLVFVTPKFQ